MTVTSNQQVITGTSYQKQAYLIKIMKQHFYTYGYQEARTASFDVYDLYQTIKGTIQPNEMLKVIHPSGDVLVLRPDVTIPITRMAATSSNQTADQWKQLFYLETIYRHTNQKSEQLQAGIENFNDNSPATDAEVLALAIQLLKDIGFTNFKIEIGHAGFFKGLLHEAMLDDTEIKELEHHIKAKNVPAITQFLDNRQIKQDVKNAIKQIPLLYGKPADVLQQAKQIVLNTQMHDELANLEEILAVLKIYNVEPYLSFDLSLINHMNYYSDIIFQGFVHDFGKPILIGGRYDTLANEFGVDLPAIGFAVQVDDMLTIMDQQGLFPSFDQSVDIAIYYDHEKQDMALTMAQTLRKTGRQVVTRLQPSANDITARHTICYDKNENTVRTEQGTFPFTTPDELQHHLKED